MYTGKHVKKTKKPIALVVSLALVLAASVLGTLAYLTVQDGPVTNTFTPAKVPNEVVEKFDGTSKNDVAITNTGDVDAYIRAAVVATWVKVDENGKPTGEVYGETPELKIDWGTEGWKQYGDYYYYTSRVAPNTGTKVLIKTCELEDGEAVPDGYTLSVEILAQSIQADGLSDDGKTPVEIAWGKDAAILVGAISEEVSGE